MKKSIVVIGLLAACLAVQPGLAQAQDSNPSGVYLGADIGLDIFNDDPSVEFDPGVLVGFKLGYRWSEQFRTEVEVGGSVADADDGNELKELGYVRLTVGAYYDFSPTNQTFVPYAGAGVGTVGIFVDDEDGYQGDGGGLTFHGEAGLAVNLNEHVALTPSYRFTWIETDGGISLDEDLTTHAFKVGVRWSF